MTIAELKAAIADMPDDKRVIVNVGYAFEDMGADEHYEHFALVRNDGTDYCEVFAPVDESGRNVPEGE